MMNIKWSKELKPANDCMYTHTYGDIPFGRCAISWKGWKEHPDFELEGGVLGSSTLHQTLAMAKAVALEIFESLVSDCLKEQP